ncbi:MAG: cupin domain-containing protein [Succinivibrio sp.]
MSNCKFSIKNIDLNANRTELHDLIQLTGCEVSINTMEAGTQSPFVHHHKENEECYIVISGSGEIVADGVTTEITSGSVFKIAPSVKRKMIAKEGGLKYICIQAQENSLRQFTFSDGVIDEE